MRTEWTKALKIMYLCIDMARLVSTDFWSYNIADELSKYLSLIVSGDYTDTDFNMPFSIEQTGRGNQLRINIAGAGCGYYHVRFSNQPVAVPTEDGATK